MEFKSKHRLEIHWRIHWEEWEEIQEEAMSFILKSYIYLFFK